MGVAGNHFAATRTLRPGIARVDARLHDFVFPAHSHDHVCIGLMRHGALSSRYGQRRHEVCCHDVILVNAGDVHDGRPAGSHGRAYSMLEIDSETFHQLVFDSIGRERIEFQAPLRRDPGVQAALTGWLDALSGNDRDVEREAAAILFGLLAPPQASRVEGPLHDVAARVRDRLRTDNGTADDIGALASDLNLSRYQLIRSFKKAFGLTPEDYRRQRRIERARRLLAGRQRLVDIAATAGFSDQSHMTREFRRMVGLTPSAYRQALR